MILVIEPITIIITILVSYFIGGIAVAQPPFPEHLSSARQTLSLTQATRGFDNILPQASFILKNELTANYPDKADKISNIVDEETIEIAVRRGNLEQEAARIFASSFTIEELELINAFFSSGIGQKYLRKTPIIISRLKKASKIWASGVQQDLITNVRNRMRDHDNRMEGY
ncbi:DUF2059 domain-containing protein [Candidatus Endowatersipora endosymbiont of Watersipora subatra]|uniref:DUF2059 domain-containing protein n=1 Tax=Candidatus Endowatersipora endosymbiont of Watersipora subatra TaxID=3077946 RepID=UPI00312C9B4C